MAVDGGGEPARSVVDEGVGRAAAVVGRHRDVAGQVAERGAPAERGELRGDPAVLVVGVDELHDAVGVGHRADQARAVDPVSAQACVAGRLDEVAIGVAVGGLAAVRGDGGDDPVVGPAHVDATTALVHERDESAVVVGEPHRGAGARSHLHGAARGVEAPDRTAEPGQVEPIGPALDQRVHPGDAAEALTLPGEVRALAVRALVVDAVGYRGEPGRGPRRPARAERPAPVGAAVVRPGEGQGGEQAGEAEVGLDLDEVADGRVDGVVRVAGGRRHAERDRVGVHQLGATVIETHRAQTRLDRGVGHVQHTVGARDSECRCDLRDPRGIVTVEVDEGGEPVHQRPRLERGPPAVHREIGRCGRRAARGSSPGRHRPPGCVGRRCRGCRGVPSWCPCQTLPVMWWSGATSTVDGLMGCSGGGGSSPKILSQPFSRTLRSSWRWKYSAARSRRFCS